MKLYRAFATVGGLTMLSRVLGFVRDILAASVLGTGWVADAFFVAFRFPNLFRRLFGEGAFNSAFVPMFARRLEEGGQEQARAFAEEALSGLLFVVLMVSALCMIAMPWLMYALAPGFADTPAKFDLAVLLTQITFPYLLCMCLVALLSGVLNTLGRFFESAAAPVLLNIVLSASLVVAMAAGLAGQAEAGVIMAWGVFLAGVLQLAFLVVGVWRRGFALRLRWPQWTPQLRRLVTLGIPGIVAGGVTQVSLMIGTIIASLQDGAVSHLYYADRIYQLPLGIVGVAIGVVLLPDVARQLQAGDDRGVQDSQNRSLEFSMLLTLPAAAALAVVSAPIVSVLFERGAFQANDTVATAGALAIFALGLPAFVLIKVFSPAYFAREDTRTPMRYAVISLIANTIGAIVLFFAFRSYGLMPHLGIAVATTAGGWLNAGLLWSALVRRGHFKADTRLSVALPRIALATAIMMAVLWPLVGFLEPGFGAANSVFVRVAALAVLIGAGALCYGACAVLLGVVQLEKFAKTFGRR